MTQIEMWQLGYPDADIGVLHKLWWLLFISAWDDVGRYHVALTMDVE